jgi:hypothetical protein
MYSSKEFRVNAQGERYLVGQFHTMDRRKAIKTASGNAIASLFLGSLYAIVITLSVIAVQLLVELLHCRIPAIDILWLAWTLAHVAS